MLYFCYQLDIIQCFPRLLLVCAIWRGLWAGAPRCQLAECEAVPCTASGVACFLQDIPTNLLYRAICFFMILSLNLARLVKKNLIYNKKNSYFYEIFKDVKKIKLLKKISYIWCYILIFMMFLPRLINSNWSCMSNMFPSSPTLT